MLFVEINFAQIYIAQKIFQIIRKRILTFTCLPPPFSNFIFTRISSRALTDIYVLNKPYLIFVAGDYTRLAVIRGACWLRKEFP